jgi:REP element-mobilizing transposase RayT
MLLIGIRADAAFLPFMTLLRQRTAIAFRRAFDESLWQEGYFERLLRSQEPTTKTIDYILNNPVKAGLVARPEDYPFAWSAPRASALG